MEQTLCHKLVIIHVYCHFTQLQCHITFTFFTLNFSRVTCHWFLNLPVTVVGGSAGVVFALNSETGVLGPVQPQAVNHENVTH